MAHPKAFPSDRRERFRGRWPSAARSEEVVSPAITMVCVLSSRRTTSSVFPGTMQAFSGKSTYHGPTGPISLKTVHWTVFRALDAPEPAASLPGEGFGLTRLPNKPEFPYKPRAAFLSPETGQRAKTTCRHKPVDRLFFLLGFYLTARPRQRRLRWVSGTARWAGSRACGDAVAASPDVDMEYCKFLQPPHKISDGMG